MFGLAGGLGVVHFLPGQEHVNQHQEGTRGANLLVDHLEAFLKFLLTWMMLMTAPNSRITHFCSSSVKGEGEAILI